MYFLNNFGTMTIHKKATKVLYKEARESEMKELIEAIQYVGGEINFTDFNADELPSILYYFQRQKKAAYVDVLKVSYDTELHITVMLPAEPAPFECNMDDILMGQFSIITEAIDVCGVFFNYTSHQDLREESLIMLSADLYKTIYKRCGNYGDTCNELSRIASEFERDLNWQEDDQRDYIEELEKFEKEYLSSLDKPIIRIMGE